jgi:hypothetical protein
MSVCVVFCATTALAGPVEVPVDGRTQLRPGRTIDEIVLRDPSLLAVIEVDGAVWLEGKASGVTAVTVTFSGGEIEPLLVVVGNGENSNGPRRQQPQTITLKHAPAQAAAPPPPAKAKSKTKTP